MLISEVRLFCEKNDVLGKSILRVYRQVQLKDGAQISSNTQGTGTGGSIRIRAGESFEASGYVTNEKGTFCSGIIADSRGTESGAGRAGNVDIEAGRIELTDGAEISSSTVGTGDGGSINIRVNDSFAASGYRSGVFASSVSKNSVAGRAGDINIQAEQVRLTDGARINSITWGVGNGGTVKIRAGESFEISGYVTNEKEIFSSGIFADSYGIEAGAGKAGDIDIQAGQIQLTDGAQISSNIAGNGDGGSIKVRADESFSALGYRTGIFAFSLSFGTEAGNAANIDIQAKQIRLSNIAKISSDTGGIKNGGNIDIQAEQIQLADGAQITSNTLGAGDGGTINIRIKESFSASGYVTNENGIFLSGVSVNTAGSGNAGNIAIQAEKVQLTDGARFNNGTSGSGDGGLIKIRAGEFFAASEYVATEKDNLSSGIFSGSSGKEAGAGKAGNIDIQAEHIELGSLAKINSDTTGAGKAGDIDIQTGQIRLCGAQISSSAQGAGTGGSINIRAGESFSASEYVVNEKETVPSGVFAMSFGTNAGNAGNISIQAGQIQLRDMAQINSGTSGTGQGGTITIRTDEAFSASGYGSGVFAGSTGTTSDAGKAGDIDIQTGQIQLADGAQINSFTKGHGEGGSINIRTDKSFSVSGCVTNEKAIFNSGIYSTTHNSGAGGKISVSSQELSLSEKGEISTSSWGRGQAGDIKLDVGNLELRGGASVASDATLSGGGRITVNAKDTVYLTDSSITTNVSSGIEKGGDITIGNPETGTGSRFVIMNHSRIQADAKGEGDGGAVFIQTENFLKSADSKVTATSERGNQGTVEIEAPDLDLSGALMFLPGSILDVTQFVPTPCAARSARTFSSFVITGPDAVPTPADDLQSAPLSATGTVFRSEDKTSISEYLNLSDDFGKKKFSPRNERCETCNTDSLSKHPSPAPSPKRRGE